MSADQERELPERQKPPPENKKNNTEEPEQPTGQAETIEPENNSRELKLAEIILNKFFVRFDAFGSYKSPGDNGKAPGVCVKQEINRETVLAHILGQRRPIGPYTHNSEEQCRFACFDFDASKEAKLAWLQKDDFSLVTAEKQQLEVKVNTLIVSLRTAKIPYMLEDSIGGYHVWVLISPPGKLEIVYKFARTFGVDCEIFPKQDYIVNGAYGNFVRMPGPYHSRTQIHSKIYDDGTWHNCADFATWEKIAAWPTITPTEIAAYLKKLDDLAKISPGPDNGGNGTRRKTKKAKKLLFWQEAIAEKGRGRWISLYEAETEIVFAEVNSQGMKCAFPPEPGPHKNRNSPGIKANPITGEWYDHYAKTGGWPLQFLMEYGNKSKNEAWQILSKFTGVVLPESVNEGWELDQIVVRDGKTWIVKINKFDVLHLVEIADFTMEIIEEISDDDKNISWKIALERPGEKTRIFEIPGDRWGTLTTFRADICKKGAYLYNADGIRQHNKFLRYFLDNSRIRQKRKTTYLGRARGKTFLSGNAVAVPGGSEKIVSIIPPQSQMRLYLPEDLLGFWRETTNIFFECYGGEFYKILGFMVGSVFCDEIVKAYNHFPLLYEVGPKGCGKSALFLLILACFGAHRELTAFNFSSTQKAWYRKAARYRGIPLVLNEYQSTKKNNSTLQSLYDREGYQRAKTDNTLDTHETEVNSSFVVVSTRNITGYESEATISRLITFDFSGIRRDQYTKDKLGKLKSRRRYLSSFVSQALQIDTKKLLQEIEAEIATVEQNTDAEFRIIENYCIIKTCANSFLETLDLLPEFGVTDEIMRDIDGQQKSTENANAANLFISLLQALCEKEEIKFPLVKIDNQQIMYFRLKEVYPLVRRFAGQAYDKDDLPDVRTIAKLLKAMGATANASRELSNSHKAIWTWNIQLNGNEENE